MTEHDSKRFTDKEVALILREASNFDEAAGSGGQTGLSRNDLEEIATEVGISVDSIARAIEQLGDRGSSGWSIAMAPRSHREAHAIQGDLSEKAMRRLILMVEDTTNTPGNVSEALGSIRWTHSDRFRTTQVAVTPGDGETAIQVTETATGRMARIAHVVPGAIGMMLASSMASAAGGLESAAVMALTAGGLIGGLAVGRTVWNRLSQKRRERTHELASALAQAAREASTATGEQPPKPR